VAKKKEEAMNLHVLEVVDGEGKKLRFVEAEDSIVARDIHQSLYPHDYIHKVRTSLDTDSLKKFTILLLEYPCTHCFMQNKKCRHLTTIPQFKSEEVFARDEQTAIKLLQETQCPSFKYKVLCTTCTERRKSLF
jgi:hypothetical protein